MSGKAFLAAIGAVAAGFAIALSLPAHPASAHPLGNFSINQLEALDLYPDRVEVAAVVDIAELPTLQEKSTVDTDGAGYARKACEGLAHDFAVTAGGHRLVWTIGATSFRYTPGSAGLSTSRLECALRAPAALAAPTTVDIANRYRADRVGWRELTALGHGVAIVDSPLPVHSISGGLTAYPKDLLSSPLNVRGAHLRVHPGTGTAGPAATRIPTAKAGFTAGAEAALRGIVGDRHLGLGVGLLAVLLSLVLGAAHAALPGHGKTVMAAYLAGRAGRPRDALAVGATVTLTHTGGVLLLGLLLTTVAGLAGEAVLGWLGVASGALVAAVGVAMLVSAIRGRRHAQHHHHHHHHDGDHDHDHDQAHDHPRPSRWATIGMGVAGGLVPSPSALVILLGAVGLGRTAFGVLLVLGYGLGMAAALTAAGFALIRLRDRLARHQSRVRRWTALLPTGTAAVVLLVGLGLAGRAAASL